MDPLDLLRPRPAMLAGVLGHRYLKNTLLLPSERGAAGRLGERPELVDEMAAMLREIEETFLEGYDPSAFVLELPSLQALDQGLRDRLLLAVRAEYASRFRPESRLEELRRHAGAFHAALGAWFGEVSTSGVSAKSTELWKTLQGNAQTLRTFLEDRELSTRWIP